MASDGSRVHSGAHAATAARPRGSRRWWLWLLLAALVAVGIVVWRALPLDGLADVEDLSGRLQHHRGAWYGLPLTILAYVVLGFLLVPMLGITLVTGLVFGPWLGALYAFVGALSSAAAGFAVGRWLGRDSVRRLAHRVPGLDKLLARRGITAAFLIRKIPAPFTLVNMIVGASRMRFLDFMLGSLLGLSAVVVALAMFGPHVLAAVRDPSPRTWFAAGALLVLLAVAILLDRALRRRRRVAGPGSAT